MSKLQRLLAPSLFLVFLLVAAGAGLAAKSTPNQLRARRSTPTGRDPVAIASADLNGDKLGDLAVANANDGTVSILYATGSGEFEQAPGSPVKTGNDPEAVAIGRFGGDKTTDIAVANAQSDNVAILQLKPNRTRKIGDDSWYRAAALATARPEFTFGEPASLVVLPGRSFDNLAVGVTGGGGAGAIEGFGAPGLRTNQVPALLATGVGNRGLAAGDIDGNGLTDLAGVNAGAKSVDVLLGQSDGSFLHAGALATGAGASSAYVGRLANVKGALTGLAITNHDDDTVTVYAQDRPHHFAAPVTLGAGSAPEGIVSGDFNGDGDLDLAVADTDGNRVTLLFGNAAGRFPLRKSFKVGSRPQALASGRFELAKRTDLAVTAANDGGIDALVTAADVDLTLSGGDGALSGKLSSVDSRCEGSKVLVYRATSSSPGSERKGTTGDQLAGYAFGGKDGRFKVRATLGLIAKGKYYAKVAATEDCVAAQSAQASPGHASGRN